MDTLQLSIVSSPVHMSIRVVKPACCFQVSSPVRLQLFSYWGGSITTANPDYAELPAGYCLSFDRHHNNKKVCVQTHIQRSQQVEFIYVILGEMKPCDFISKL